jgi:hypothetical protein
VRTGTLISIDFSTLAIANSFKSNTKKNHWLQWPHYLPLLGSWRTAWFALHGQKNSVPAAALLSMRRCGLCMPLLVCGNIRRAASVYYGNS